MESIGYFFSRVLGGFFDRLFDSMRYKITDVAEFKLRETMEKPFNQSGKTSQHRTTDYQEQNPESSYVDNNGRGK